MRRPFHRFIVFTSFMVLSFAGGACSDSSAEGSSAGIVDSSNPDSDSNIDSGSATTGFDTGDTATDTNDINVTGMPEGDAEILRTITEEANASSQMTSAELLARYPSQARTELDYAPLDAQNLELIQASDLAMNDMELALLDANGFTITGRHSFLNFFDAYSKIYKADLPVYISADAILDTVHRSFDDILENIEIQILHEKLDVLLNNLRNELTGSTSVSEDIRNDLDFYLTVAHSLLNDKVLSATFADASAVDDFFQKAQAASGVEEVTLFASKREIDFSQFTPRGHYTHSEELSAYFRAMIWLGRIDFRMVETMQDGTQVVQRPQLQAVLALHTLTEKHLPLWQQINEAIELFVGESDNLTPLETGNLYTALGISNISDLDALSDDAILNIILSNGLGAQRISSHIMAGGYRTTLPLNASYLIFGQRFTVDSHVFSNLVYDRVMGGTVKRMMPSPLDVGFAVLNNNQAGALLQSELEKYGYAPDLHMMRTITATYDDDFWDANLYNLWLRSLQTLSESESENMPSFTQTAQWQTRMLNTQLGSWAQLRHDTILYAKQSYTSGPSCEFPDAYVEPYPAFFERIAAYADKAVAAVGQLDNTGSNALLQGVLNYFTELAFISDILHEMAQQQRDGIPYTEEQLAFVNDAFRIEYEPAGCYEREVPAGWYKKLFFDPESALEFDPTIADVHTQPADEVGNRVGKVLHVATAAPRLMIVTANQCSGPRAYAGAIFSYHEVVTQDFQRLTDEEWSYSVYTEMYPEYDEGEGVPFVDPPWMAPLISE